MAIRQVMVEIPVSDYNFLQNARAVFAEENRDELVKFVMWATPGFFTEEERKNIARDAIRRVLHKIESHAQPTTPEESSEAVSGQPPAGESPSAQALPPPLAEDLGREGARIVEAAAKLRDALAEWAHEGRMEKMSNELRGEGPESELEAARNQRDYYKAMIEATTKERDQLAAAFEPLKAKIFEVEGQRNRLSHDNDLLRKQIGTLRDKVDKAEKERHLSRATVTDIRRLLQQRPNA